MKSRPSMTPAAIRKRRVRAEERASRAASSAAARPPAGSYTLPGKSYAPPAPFADPAWVSASDLSDTVPVDGPGPSAFLMSPLPPEVSELADGLASIGVDLGGTSADEPPLVEPSPPPPAAAPAPADERTVKAIGAFVGGFFATGVIALLETSPPFVAFVASMAGTPEAAMAYLPSAVGVVSGSAEALARKYRLRLPFQDEIVVAIALGIGGYGLARKRRIMADIGAAQNANAPAVPERPAEPESEPLDPRTAPPARPAPGVRVVDADEVAA